MNPSSRQTSDPSQQSTAMDQPRELFLLEADNRDDPRLVNFHQTEHDSGMTYRWSESVSLVRIRIAPAPVSVSIDTGCLRGATVPFPFAIYWNEYLVPRKAICIRQGVISFEIDSRFSEPIGEQKLTISCKPLNAENGRRKLGMPICSIRVIESGPAKPRFSLEKHRPVSFWKNPIQRWKKKADPTIPIWKVRAPDTSSVTPAKVVTSLRSAASLQCDQVVVASWDSAHGREIEKSVHRLFENSDWQRLALVQSTEGHENYPINPRMKYRLPDHLHSTRQQIYDQVIDWFGEVPPKQAYVVPNFSSDYIIALALKDIFQTRVCLHVVEDRCLHGTSHEGDPSQNLLQESIDKCDLLFVVSPEMRQAYENHFGRAATLFPPIVPQAWIPQQRVDSPAADVHLPDSLWNRLKHWIPHSSGEVASPKKPMERAILIGEFSDRRSLEETRNTIRTSGIQFDWFLEDSASITDQVSREDLQTDGIHLREVVWNQEIIRELRQRPLAILPSGKLDGRDREEGSARLSLPSCLPLVVATAHLPVIVMGSPQTCVAEFVSRFSLGLVTDYDGKELRRAALEIARPDWQKFIRQKALEIGQKFCNAGLQEWVWLSLEQGQPADKRFDELFPIFAGKPNLYFNPQAPPEIHWAFRDTWRAINRIKQNGFMPDVIIDVGASTGIWSWTASRVFSDARFLMIDPLFPRYDANARQFFQSAIRKCEALDVALSDHCGETEMRVAGDLYTSSLLPVELSGNENESVWVSLLTLDELAKQQDIQGRALLKIDVQFAEYLVINGGLNFIRHHVDYIILELTLNPTVQQARSYPQMLDMMDQLGFDVIDEIEGWRNPKTGVLEQKDTVFVRREKHPLYVSPAKPFRRAA